MQMRILQKPALKLDGISKCSNFGNWYFIVLRYTTGNSLNSQFKEKSSSKLDEKFYILSKYVKYF